MWENTGGVTNKYYKMHFNWKPHLTQVQTKL